MCGVRVGSVELLVDFRSGLRRPLTDQAVVEIWINLEHVGSLTGETVRHLIQHHMTDFELRRRVTDQLAARFVYTAVLRKPEHPVSAERRQALRGRRRTRKRQGG